MLDKCPIVKDINITLWHWSRLVCCEYDPYLINNNHTEREIKPFGIARKNLLFAGSQESEIALCLHFSLIRTSKLRKLEPYQYYVEIMKAIPYCKKDEDYEALLP